HHAEGAARLLGAAHAAAEAVGVPQLPHHGQFNVAVAETRSRLGEETFRAANASWSASFAARTLPASQEVVPPEHPKREVTAQSLGLTARELEVLRLIVAGLGDREIGDALFISPRTAQKHAAAIFGKLGVNSRTAATSLALRAQLL